MGKTSRQRNGNYQICLEARLSPTESTIGFFIYQWKAHQIRICKLLRLIEYQQAVVFSFATIVCSGALKCSF